MKRRALTPTVVRLGAVSFLADVSSEMLYPITPIFLTAVLGASPAALGLIEGLAEASASLIKAYSGRWSDRSGRRTPFVWGGYLLAALAKPLIGFAGSWPAVLAARALDRAGKGLRGAPRDALLAEGAPADVLGAALGWHRTMDTLGAALGPILALIYLHNRGQDPASLRALYGWALLPGLAAAAVALTVREARSGTVVREAGSEPSQSTGQLDGFWRAIAAWTVFAAVNSSDAFLLLKAESSGLGLEATIGLYCAYNLVCAGASPYLGGLSDRIGRKPVLVGGLIAFAAVYAAMGFATGPWQFGTLFLIYGLYMAATDGVGKAFALDFAGPEGKASAVGVWNAASGAAALVASVAAGALWTAFGPAAAFLYGSLGALVAAAMLLSMR